MSLSEDSFDRRKSFRCPVWHSRQDGELKVGAVWIPVQLLDESAGGFAVLVDSLPHIKVDDAAQFRTEAGWFDVRVANVTQLEPAETADKEGSQGSAETEQPTPVFRLGLDRLGELVVPEEDEGPRAGRTFHFHLARFFPSDAPMLMLGAVVVLLLVILPIATLTLPSYRGSLGVKRVSRWLDRTLGGFRSDGATRRQRQAAGRSAQPKWTASSQRTQPNRSHTAAPDRPTADNTQQLRNLARRMQGATVFSLPEVIRKLELSDSQQARIREIVDISSQAIQQFDARRQDSSRQQRSRTRTMILRAARREVLDMLTEEQRVRWQKLVE